MDKLIEQLRKDARPIVVQCTGQGLLEVQAARLDPKNPVCSRIEPIEVFDILDEETGEIDPESKPELSRTDSACRCTAYAFPEAKWKNGICPLATHIQGEAEAAAFTRVGQQKQKKKK